MGQDAVSHGGGFSEVSEVAGEGLQVRGRDLNIPVTIIMARAS